MLKRVGPTWREGIWVFIVLLFPFFFLYVWKFHNKKLEKGFHLIGKAIKKLNLWEQNTPLFSFKKRAEPGEPYNA